MRPPSRQRIRTCKRTQDEKENNPVGVLDPLRPEKADLRGVGPTVGGLGVGPRLALGPLLLAAFAACHGRLHLGLLGFLHLEREAAQRNGSPPKNMWRKESCS